MTELDNDALMLARGRYSTIRAAHEDSKKQLAVLCGALQAVSTKVLFQMQPREEEIPVSVSMLVEQGREVLTKIEACAREIEALAIQRAALKGEAWPR